MIELIFGSNNADTGETWTTISYEFTLEEQKGLDE